MAVTEMGLGDLLRDVGSRPLHRAFALDRKSIDEEARTVALAFSSEEEYERFFGVEILDHDEKSVRMGRLNDGAAVLVNHNTDDQVGVTEEASIDTDRRGRAVVRFGESERAREIFHDIVTGIRKHVSVGYMVHKMVLEEERDGAPSVYRVTDWEPIEISIVPVPADATVGVGRSADRNGDPREEPAGGITEEKKMDDQNNKVETPDVDVKAVKQEARDAEITRMREINELGETHGQGALAKKFIHEGRSADEFRAAILEAQGQLRKVDSSPDIGLGKKETRNFSVIRALRALANPDKPSLREEAAFEFECSSAVEKQMGRTAQGVLIPSEVLNRDMTVGTDADGGYLVGTDHKADSFIEVLRNRMMVRQMGATEMGGLIGDVAIPAMTAAHTAYWVAESGSPTESKPTIAQKALTPKTVGAYDDISRKLLKQSSPAADALVLNDIAAVLGIGIDLAALHGTGSSNQPTGIAATSGIGSVAGGTNGLAPAWSHIVTLETEVAQDNADVGKMGYLTNAKVRGKLRQVFKNATYGLDPIWSDGDEPGFGMVNGYRAGVSNQVSSALTKGSSSGVCSAIFFGNWADLVIGMWGTLDLMVDPYTGSSSGTVRIVGLQDVDILVRHPQSFSAMLDALTS